MNDLLAEWISKAEGDYVLAQREIRVRKGAAFIFTRKTWLE